MERKQCRNARALLVLPVVLILLVAPATSFSTSALQSTDARCLSQEEALLLDRINTFREMNGLSRLAASPTLSTAARHHAESMATHNYFPADYSVQFEGPNHDQTITWQQNIANAGYPDNTHTTRSEIIGAGTDSVALIQRSLTGIAAFEAILSDRRFQAVGIGFGTNPNSDEGTYWVITFGSLRDAVISPCEGVTVQAAIERGGRTDNSTGSELAYDGDFSTAWSTETDEPPRRARIWFDLGSIQQISAIEWMMSEPGGADEFTIEVSLDRETWSPIAKKSNGAVNEWRTASWQGRARYIRFDFRNPNGDPVLGYLAEVRIFR
jgi:uncharacterized protein YkwD